MRPHTNSFEKVLEVEKSRNRYFFRNAFCMRKDEGYHKIFYAFENICDILTLRDTNNQVLKHCMMKIQFATYLVNTKYCQIFSSQVLFFRYVFWHLQQLVSCPISTICVRSAVHRALSPKLKPLYSAFNTSALSIAILSILTT